MLSLAQNKINWKNRRCPNRPVFGAGGVHGFKRSRICTGSHRPASTSDHHLAENIPADIAVFEKIHIQ